MMAMSTAAIASPSSELRRGRMRRRVAMWGVASQGIMAPFKWRRMVAIPTPSTTAMQSVQALRTVAQTLTDVFTYTMQDGSSASSVATITVTIQGRNDAPVAVANTTTATEAGGINNNISGTDPTGNVLTNDTDVDASDTKTVIGVAAGNPGSASGFVGTSVVGTYGTLVLQANGTYTYTLDNNNATVEALNAASPTLTGHFHLHAL